MGNGLPNDEIRLAPWRRRLHEIIFEADTPAGKAFDVGLLVAIGLSVLVVMLESVTEIRDLHSTKLITSEWIFTILFTIEYILRLSCVRKPHRYATSFFGVVDLLAVLPTYLTLVLPGSAVQSLMVIRALRLLRVFRIFKLAQFLTEAKNMKLAIWASRAKITVFLATVAIIVVIMGSLMHLVEGPENGFTSIPRSIYWAIVTLTTVGYGDLSPKTSLGQGISAMMMIVGYSFIIIVPMGIIYTEWLSGRSKPISTQSCPSCTHEGHDTDATFCKYCGARL